VHKGFWWGNLSETDHFENLSENGIIICERILKDAGWRGKDWNELAQDRDRRRDLINAVMNLRVS